MIVWPESLECDQDSKSEATPETILDAQIVLVETIACLSGDLQFVIALAEARSSVRSLTLGGPDPLERVALGRADGGSAVEYQEPAFVLGPVQIWGFTEAAAYPCSSEFVEGSIWAWSGAEGVIAACWQETEGLARGDASAVGVGGFLFEAGARRTRGNSAGAASATMAT